MNNNDPTQNPYNLNPEYTLNSTFEEINYEDITSHRRGAKLGPIELSILERLENRLAQDILQPEEQEQPKEDSEISKDQNEKNSILENLPLTGDREILHIQGWLKESGVFNRYLAEYVYKFILGIFGIFFVLRKTGEKKTFFVKKNQDDDGVPEPVEARHIERWWILALITSLFCVIHMVKSFYFLWIRKKKFFEESERSLDDMENFHDDSNLENREISISQNLDLETRKTSGLKTINSVLFYEFLFNFCYCYYFIFLAIYFSGIEDTFRALKPGQWWQRRGGIKGVLLVFAPLPLFTLSVHICRKKQEEYSYVSSKALSILETVQMIILGLKLTGISSITWQYATVILAVASIYIMIVGLIHLVLATLAYFKEFGMLFMSIYYIGYGHAYLNLIRGFVLDYEFSRMFIALELGFIGTLSDLDGDSNLKFGNDLSS